MLISIVIGALYGDEGKGSTVSYLASKSYSPLVVRFSGGAQAGHTVVHNGRRHVFSHFGSGTLNGAETYWSKYCYTEPGALITEYETLVGLGANPVIHISPESPVVTPYDIMANRLDSKNLSHGTCGMGIGMAAKRTEETPYQLQFNDLMQPEWILDLKLKSIADYYGYVGGTDEGLDSMIGEFLKYVGKIKRNPIIMSALVMPDKYDHIIFEGSQGILLDRDRGFFPHVTRAHTTSKNAWEIIGNNPTLSRYKSAAVIYYVTRSYLTRHGNGPMSSTTTNVDLINNERETNVTNEFQGEFRTSAFDFDLLTYALQGDEGHGRLNNHLVVTCMDQHPDKDNIPYIYDGDVKTASIEEFQEALNLQFDRNIIFSYGEEFINVDDIVAKLKPEESSNSFVLLDSFQHMMTDTYGNSMYSIICNQQATSKQDGFVGAFQLMVPTGKRYNPAVGDLIEVTLDEKRSMTYVSLAKFPNRFIKSAILKPKS